MPKMKISCKEFADKLVGLLKGYGFIVQRYDAKSSHSIYIKLDWGACYTIRISDHESKKHWLKYRFNVNVKSKEQNKRVVNDRGFERVYYTGSMLQALLADIRDTRMRKKMYGEAHYRHWMNVCRDMGEGRKGFWEQAVVV